MQDRIGIDQYGVSVGCKARSGSRLVVKRGPMTVSDLLVDAGVDHGCGKLKLHRPRAISRSLIGDLAAPHDRAPRWAVSRPIVIHDLFAVLLRTAGRFCELLRFLELPSLLLRLFGRASPNAPHVTFSFETPDCTSLHAGCGVHIIFPNALIICRISARRKPQHPASPSETCPTRCGCVKLWTACATPRLRLLRVSSGHRQALALLAPPPLLLRR